MILDLNRFILREEPYWKELEGLLEGCEHDPAGSLEFQKLRRLHYLVTRTGAALNRIVTFSAETEIRNRLETLVARSHALLHARESGSTDWSFRKWFTQQAPQAFRRRFSYFATALTITLLGALVGALLLGGDLRSRQVIFPFEHLLNSPKERVQEEETRKKNPIDEHRGSFAGQLMTHNIQVSLLVLGIGILWGIGSVILLFYNGVILGAVCYDYLNHGLGVFLAGWLLPHGIIEIPAILVAGQAGLLLAHAVIGDGSGRPLNSRLASVQTDVLHLAGLLAVMLVWAGIIEAFFSQYHEPRLPYALKIGFGILEGLVLVSYWTFAGRLKEEPPS